MAVPFSIVKSELDFFEFTYHSAVTWHNNRTIIVWGGYEWGDPLGGEDNSVVHYHLNGEWIGVNTSGKVPCSSFDGEAQVVDDKMIVLCTGKCRDRGKHWYRYDSSDYQDTFVHTLDLKTWKWTRSSPSGIPPFPTVPMIHGGPSSWTYKGKIFYFGGGGDSEYWLEHMGKHEYPSYLNLSFRCGGHGMASCNQLFCYNIAENSWEWPPLAGEIPSPRRRHRTIISDDTVFLHGGNGTENVSYNDLHVLDMTNLRWRKVHGQTDLLPREKSRCFHHTLTLLSPSTAVLFGQKGPTNAVYRDDSWLLNLRNAKEQSDPASIWTPIRHHFRHQTGHAAALEPVSQSVWVIADMRYVLKVTRDLVPLKALAMDHVARSNAQLLADQLPIQLKNEVQAYRSRMGDTFLCSRETGCKVCKRPREEDDTKE